jgi:hypothetical protein
MFRRLARSLRTAAAAAAPQVRAPQVHPVVEPLEQRQLMSVSPVVMGTRIKVKNLFNGNISANSSLVTLAFGSTDPKVSNDVTLVDPTKIRMFAYAINPLSAKLGQIKKTIVVTKAEVLALDTNGDGKLDHNILQLTTDRLVRKGATVVINLGTLKDVNGNDVATQTGKTAQGQNRERFTLANRAFLPTDFTRYTSDIFASSPNPAAQGGTIDEATATAELKAFLDKKVTAGIITQAKEDAAMTRFSSTAAKGTIPDHNLRAALFSLTGTFAEGAIASWLDGANVTGKPYTIIAFQDPGDATVVVAKTTARPTDGRLRTVFRPEFSGESFIALSDWIAHEALHQDNQFTLQEEKVANTFGTLIAAQQAQVDSSWMKTPTKLVNMENDALLAMINSGRTIWPYTGVLQAPMIGAANGVFPGQKAPSDAGGVYKSWDDYISRQYVARGAQAGNTPGNTLLNQYYTAVTGVTAPANLQFSDAIINQIDAFQSVLGTHPSIVVAQALRCALS